jgi:hypothetical protein
MKAYSYRRQRLDMECHFCNKKVDYDIKVNMLNDPQWVEYQCCKECMEKKKMGIRGTTITG